MSTNQSNDHMSVLRKLQLVELDILRYTIKVLDDNNIQYYLGFGTLLGAIRHNGFIPWDDDIDLFIPRPDYDRLLEMGDALFEEPYVLFNPASMPQNKNSSFDVKIVSTKDRLVKHSGQYMEREIWIDVKPMDGVPRSKLLHAYESLRLNLLSRLMRFNRASIYGTDKSKSRSLVEKIAIWMNRSFGIGKLLSMKRLVDRFNAILSHHDYHQSNLVYVYTPDYARKRLVYHKQWFGTGRTVLFEGIEMKVPVESEKVLAQCYGDYLALPPESQRSPKHAPEYRIEHFD